MKVYLSPGCDLDWLHSLSPWQHETLAAIYRQGKGLPDRTNHGSDHRWQQAGCKTRQHYGGWRRNGHGRHYHQAVYIERVPDREWFIIHFIRRDNGIFAIAEDTHGPLLVPLEDAWTSTESWYCTPGGSQSFHPEGETARQWFARRSGLHVHSDSS